MISATRETMSDRYTTTPHPVAVLTPDQVRERAAQVLDDVVCLVPKDLMRGILGQALGVSPDAIDLTYPSTSEQER